MELGLQLGGTALLSALYAAGFARVRGRTPRWRAGAFALAVAALLVAFTVPLEQRFSTHMVQHLLIGDVAPLFLVIGLTGPLLRPLLAFRAARKLRVLAHPLVALPLWVANLAAWHSAPLYDAALRHTPVHALQHAMFFMCGTLLWSALLEPLPGPAWFTTQRKLLYVGAMWLTAMSLSQVLLWSGHAYYTGYGLSDQRAGGGVMLVEGSLVMIGVAAWLLLGILGESGGAYASDRWLDSVSSGISRATSSPAPSRASAAAHGTRRAPTA